MLEERLIQLEERVQLILKLLKDLDEHTFFKYFKDDPDKEEPDMKQ